MTLPRLQLIPALCLAAALPMVASCGKDVRAASEARPPSVILISLDTLRARHMSLYGYERETTPYLERFAEECLVFEEARTVAPWTLISHMSMLTGLYPEQHGVNDDDLALSTEIPFLTQRLADTGYQTFGFYKPAFIGVPHGHDRGFDVFEQHNSAAEAEVHLTAHLPEIVAGQPSFVFLHLFDIHSAPHERRNPLYYRPPGDYGTMFQSDAPERLADFNLHAARRAKATLNPDQKEALTAMYDGGIRYVDDQLSKWIEGWRASGLLDNAILVITADHGEALGQRGGHIRGHGKMFQEALHVPLIVRFPDGYRAGQRESGRVSIVDIVPTLLEAAWIDPDPRLPGHSLRETPNPERVLSANRHPIRARMRGPWKIIQMGKQPPILFNLSEDPMERNPVLDPARAKAMMKELDAWFEADLASRPAFDAPPHPRPPLRQADAREARSPRLRGRRLRLGVLLARAGGATDRSEETSDSRIAPFWPTEPQRPDQPKPLLDQDLGRR